MKTRLFSRVVAFCLLLITAGLGFNSCKPPLEPPPIVDAEFGSIRVMNFIECPSDPIDIFIFKTGSLDTVITRSLRYSVGSAYATNLTPGVYNVEVRPLNRSVLIKGTTVNVKADSAVSVMIFGKGNPLSGGTEPQFNIAADQNITPASDKVYVRFLNTKEIGGTNVDLIFDNPLNPAIPQLSNIPPKSLTSYVELGHALDTTYTMYLVRSDNHEVIARLAGAAFGPGQFYTIVYAGNENSCRDTSALKADTLRLRYFDDNQQGNDLTLPLVQSLRFNFINGLIPPPDATGDQRTYVSAGVVLNNDDRFLIPTIKPLEMARNLGDEGNGVITGGFFTIPWTDAIQVSMYANIFDDQGKIVDGKRGIRLIDLRAGNRKEVKSDVPFSIIILDTVSNKYTNGLPVVDSSKILNWSVPLPDVPKAGKAQLVLVNALAPAPKDGSQTPSRFAKFYVNGAAPKVFTTAQRAPKSDVFEVDANGEVEIKVEIGRSEVLQTFSTRFTPVDNGIYEVVLLGQRNNPNDAHKPKLMIIHTNKPNS